MDNPPWIKNRFRLGQFWISMAMLVYCKGFLLSTTFLCWNWQRSQERLLRTEPWPEMPRSLESNGRSKPLYPDGCSSSKNWNLWAIQSHIFVVYDPKTLFALWKARGEWDFFSGKLGGRVVRRKSGSEVQFWNASPHVSSTTCTCGVIFLHFSKNQRPIQWFYMLHHFLPIDKHN